LVIRLDSLVEASFIARAFSYSPACFAVLAAILALWRSFAR
jgi:hypothetical protein